MLNFWKGISSKKLEEAEKDVVALSDIPIEEFESYPVHITFTEKDWDPEHYIKLLKQDASAEKSSPDVDLEDSVEDNEYIWTYQFGNPSKPALVMIHGFAGSGLIFYRMFKFLRAHFNIYLIDLMGWARSSRHDFKCSTYQECELYYVNSIEKWRQKMGFETMNLLGHSFGGFIASKYAMHHPEKLNKLILFSPHGVETTNKKNEEEKDHEMVSPSILHRAGYRLFQK